jgi:deferrochelatase/peroxidase EfeB
LSKEVVGVAATVNVQDVQSLAFSGHLGLPHAIATRLTVKDAPAARTALRAIVEAWVNFGVPHADRKSAVQLLLSAEGLLALKAPGKQVAALARPFQQGMVMPHRSRALGDLGRNAPSQWLWCERSSHAWLLIYADTESTATMVCDNCVEQLQPSWVEQDRRLPLRAPGDAREPFGFLDGVGRMRVDIGDGRPAEPDVDVMPAGELILGYRNALGTHTVIPPLGRNGSYVVIRQLEQDVESFWSFWMQQGGDNETAVWLASKAVGRWPNGMPVSGESPRPEPPYVEADVRGRLSFQNDTERDRCPLGAHIRRANPRDGLPGDPERSLTIAGQHRLLRRGRVYGTPAPADWMPNFRPEPYARENGAGDATEGVSAVCSAGSPCEAAATTSCLGAERCSTLWHRAPTPPTDLSSRLKKSTQAENIGRPEGTF